MNIWRNYEEESKIKKAFREQSKANGSNYGFFGEA